MSIQRIYNARCGSYGYQARAYLPAQRRLTRFFADDAHGGQADAWQKAVAAEQQLKSQAEKVRARLAFKPEGEELTARRRERIALGDRSGYVDCGECPAISTGCKTGHCLKGR